MSVILLVRHGQASFGKADYDVLSDLGKRQSRVLGRALAARGVRPDLVVTGSMRRHRSTLEHAVDAAGWHDVAVTVDQSWDEFDHEQVIEVHRPAYRSSLAMRVDLARTLQPRKAFQAMFEEATAQWASGEHDHAYAETFTAFGARVEQAVRRTTASLGQGQTVVVFTSGGPIARFAAELLAPDPACTPALWGRLNLAMINTALTKVLVGSRGHTLVSLNDHSHLETAGPGLVSYR